MNLEKFTDRAKGFLQAAQTVAIRLYKRLERGRYQWPRNQEEVLCLSPQQFRWLLEGLSIHQPKAHQAVKDIVYM